MVSVILCSSCHADVSPSVRDADEFGFEFLIRVGTSMSRLYTVITIIMSRGSLRTGSYRQQQ